MAYTKTTWVNDQQPDIDADNLNKMEQGIADAQFPDGGTEGQLLARTANGQGWVDPPNSAVWGGITGDIADQTDLQAALSSVGKVDSVNGIQPDVSKNVQVDVEITKDGWDALPSTKYTDDINYYIKDGTNIPQAGVISASGVTYSNTSSGLDATTVQGAIDENASEIADVKAGLTSLAHDAITSAPLAVNGTYQIPTTILNHKIVILIFRRYGHIGSTVLLSENIRAGVATEGSTIYPFTGVNYTYIINGTGLLTLTAMTGNIEPYVQVVGIL